VKICKLLNKLLDKYDEFVPFEYYNPSIIKSGINKFSNSKKYLDTSSIEGINNIINSQYITYNKRPSRANMQPIKKSVWFAKMKESRKILIVADEDYDIFQNNILSTGFMGVKASKQLPLSLLTAIIISQNFIIQRDLNSVGTTMAGINNNTFYKILVPKLNEEQTNSFNNEYYNYVYLLSLLRRKIKELRKIKNLMLTKYF